MIGIRHTCNNCSGLVLTQFANRVRQVLSGPGGKSEPQQTILSARRTIFRASKTYMRISGQKTATPSTSTQSSRHLTLELDRRMIKDCHHRGLVHRKQIVAHFQIYINMVAVGVNWHQLLWCISLERWVSLASLAFQSIKSQVRWYLVRVKSITQILFMPNSKLLQIEDQWAHPPQTRS